MGQYTWCYHNFAGLRFVFQFKKVATLVSFVLLLLIRLMEMGILCSNRLLFFLLLLAFVIEKLVLIV